MRWNQAALSNPNIRKTRGGQDEAVPPSTITNNWETVQTVATETNPHKKKPAEKQAHGGKGDNVQKERAHKIKKTG